MIYKKDIQLEDIKGVIEIELPKYKDRMAIIKSMNINFGKDGELKFEANQLDIIEKMSDIVNERIKKVSLETIDGDKIESLGDLEYYSVYSEIINELINIVFNGAKLGKQR